MTLRIGVVGCGTIGGEICAAIDGGTVPATLVGISDASAEAAERLASRLRSRPPILPLERLIASADLIVEATARSVAPGIILAALRGSANVMVMSVGGLLACREEACALAEKAGRQIYVPSGAIAALDAVKGAAVGRIDQVRLTTRKPPRALDGAPYVVQQGIRLDQISHATTIFSGSALEAIDGFPANVNVAIALSLAGLGPEKTQVRVVADPGCDRNIHEVEVEGEFGRLVARVENLPSPTNPKTSYMAALSAIALLKRLTSSLVVGT